MKIKEGQLLRVKVIRTGHDVPEDDGEYICFLTKHKGFAIRDKEAMEGDIRFIEWYLQPIELKEIMPTDEEITEQAELHFDKHTIACRTWIGGAKWRKSEIEKRNKF